MTNFRFLVFFAIYIKISVEYSQIIFIKDDKMLKLDSPCLTSKGASGICQRVRDCPEERFKLDRRDICFFERNYPVVCCENVKLGPIYVTLPPSQQVNFSEIFANTLKNPINETTDIKGPPPLTIELPLGDQIYNDRVRNSERLPNKYCVEVPFLKEPSENDTSHILFTGGNLSKALDNPQMAAIGWRNTAGGENIEWKCGGSLISHNFIITAAHCTSDRGQSAEVVRVGDLNLLKKGDIKSQDFIITDIFIHPQYHRQLLYHDIALIKISPNASFTDFVKPACLWIEKDVPLKELIAMGYGTNAFAGKQTNELYEGNLEHVTNDNCREAFGIDVKIPNGIVDSQVCAKDPKAVADTCQGDSGGPLIFRSGKGVFQRQHLIGITSFGESCAGPTPGVYTRVSSYIDWIESVVWPAGSF